MTLTSDDDEALASQPGTSIAVQAMQECFTYGLFGSLHISFWREQESIRVVVVYLAVDQRTSTVLSVTTV